VLARGPLQVIRDGETLPVEAWGSAKARELLLFLLCHPAGCTREQVGVALWPDASSARLRNIFHVTLHRLRRALGHAEWIVLAGDRYVVEPSLAWELDASVFERETKAALRELRKSPAALDALQRALALYRGDFLATELVGDWHLEPRDRLARLCVDALLALGGALLDAGRIAEAGDAFRRVLERDSVHEDAWRRLMLCHARLGERPQAIRLYQRLERLLRDELETDPAPETVRLHELLQRGAEV
jgi:DNA-binding SARP family transcriptional activator